MMKIFMFLFGILLMNLLIDYIYLFNLIFIMILLMILNLNNNFYWMNMYYLISNDLISFNLSILTIYITSLMLMYKFKTKNLKNYNYTILFLLLFLLLTFNTMNYFLFYLFFEISLIPTFYLIMGWGYQPERIQSSLFLLFYTLFASLPLMILIFLLMKNLNSIYFMFMNNNNIIYKFNNMKLIFYLYMLFAYLVKLPMYLIHLWLPKAHVEAPVTGSMILAGIMLKLGGYGLMRSMLMMLKYCKKFNDYIMILSLLSLINLSLICLQQNDLKALVAYSSIVHMMLMLMGMMTMKKIGFISSLIMMISHGLCSSALFYLVNLNYEKLKTRNFLIIKGMILIMPILSMWFFMFCAINMSSPPSLNLLSELMIFNIMLNWSFNIILFLMLSMLLMMMYSLYLFSYSQHGSYFNNYINFNNINLNNYLNLTIHWIPLNLMIMKSNLLMF